MGAGVAWVAHGGRDIGQAVAMLAIAGGVTLGVMVLAMQRLHDFHLDLLRWGWALLLVAGAATLAARAPLVPAGIGAALTIVALVGLATVVSMVALIWKNPGTTRLLAVSLQPTLTQGAKS